MANGCGVVSGRRRDRASAAGGVKYVRASDCAIAHPGFARRLLRFCFSVKSPGKKNRPAPGGPPFSAWSLPRVAAALFLTAFVAGLILYLPALRGAFVLDDHTLPFHHLSLTGVRPVLMFSYWANYQLFGDTPSSYHLVNLLIHVSNTCLVFLILFRLLSLAGWTSYRRTTGSAVGALIFLIHPLQTESVSYIAGRSESMAALFVLLAYAVFLYRRHESISWMEAAAVLVLFGLGVSTKEN